METSSTVEGESEAQDCQVPPATACNSMSAFSSDCAQHLSIPWRSKSLRPVAKTLHVTARHPKSLLASNSATQRLLPQRPGTGQLQANVS